MKDRIVEEVKMAKETGRITSEGIYEIVRKAVSDVVSEAKGGAERNRSSGRICWGTRQRRLSARTLLKQRKTLRQSSTFL